MERRDINIDELKNLCKKIRVDTINMSAEYCDGHVASSFSYVEILVVLYSVFIDDKSQFILSKGHGAFALYAMLRNLGYNPKISGHPDIETDQGIMCTTGSLGHGIAIAVGKALAKKIKKEKGTIYVVVGDGECQEGSVWESMNIASKYKLDNLVVIIDHNKLQALDAVENIANEKRLGDKFRAFGAEVVEVDGHSVEELIDIFYSLNNRGLPYVVIAHTVKGKGVSFMEFDPKWQSRMLAGDEMQAAISEIMR